MNVYIFGGNKKVSRTIDSSQILRVVEDDYLKRDGSSGATGPLNMDENKISKVIDPEDDQDVATKMYVDSREVLPNSKGPGYLLVSSGNRIGEASKTWEDVEKTMTELVERTTDLINDPAITDSKGAGYFLVSGENGEVTESSVKQEKYHEIHTLLQDKINKTRFVHLPGTIQPNGVFKFEDGTRGDYTITSNKIMRANNLGNLGGLAKIEIYATNLIKAETQPRFVEITMESGSVFSSTILGGTAGSVPTLSTCIPLGRLENQRTFSLLLEDGGRPDADVLCQVFIHIII